MRVIHQWEANGIRLRIIEQPGIPFSRRLQYFCESLDRKGFDMWMAYIDASPCLVDEVCRLSAYANNPQ